MCVCTHIYIYIYIYVCVRIYIYIYIHTVYICTNDLNSGIHTCRVTWRHYDIVAFNLNIAAAGGGRSGVAFF